MTVSTEVDHNDYVGNGVTTVFPYQFRIFKAADITVVTVDLNENQRELILGTDYTVAGAGSYQGGNVTLMSALENGWKISIARELPVTQETDLRNQGKFFAEVHENAFDKLTMLIQQTFSRFSLALRKPSFIANYYDALNNRIRNLRDPSQAHDAANKSYVDSVSDTNISRTLRVSEPINQLPDALSRANKMPAFDNFGNAIVVIPPSGSASDVMIELAKPSGSERIGVQPVGTLSDTIHTVSAEQWGAVGDGVTDCSASIQAAIDYMSAHGGGIVELGVGEYRAILVQKPRVLLKGQGMLLTKIKAPEGWNARAVIESWNYDYAVSVGSGSPDPGCYCAGYMDLTVDGNLQNWSGTASENSGYGILHLGACMVFRNVQVIYSPGINLRTIDWGVNREKYAAVMPGWSWPIIGVLDNIRLKMCGNDNWVCEAQDYFATNIEIHDAGYPFPSSDDVRSFLYPTQRVTNFLLLRSIDIGFLHSYGCWGGYGMVAGPDTTTFFIRVKWDSIILESCNQAHWFKKSSYLQGSKLDIHECSGHESVPLHGDFVKAPIGVFESTYRPSYINTVVINQLTPEYNGIQALVSGQLIKMNITATRSDTTGANNSGTGIWLTGSYNELDVTAKGFLGTNDSEGNPSSAIVAVSGGGNTVNCNIGFSRNGVRLLAQGVITAGELKTILASVDTPFTGFSALSVAERRRVSLLPGNSGGNRLNVFSGALDLTDTSVKTISVPVNIAYRPTASELSFNMEIQSTGGSSVYPNLKFISYSETSSSATSLVFSYQSISSSPMGVRLAIRLG